MDVHKEPGSSEYQKIALHTFLKECDLGEQFDGKQQIVPDEQKNTSKLKLLCEKAKEKMLTILIKIKQ